MDVLHVLPGTYRSYPIAAGDDQVSWILGPSPRYSGRFLTFYLDSGLKNYIFLYEAL